MSEHRCDVGKPGAPMASAVCDSNPDASIVSAQIGRAPRAPWRVDARCRIGYPTVIVSPSLLEDGTPFPTFAWLVCPWLVELASAAESQGASARWAARALTDEDLRSALAQTERDLIVRRAAESGGSEGSQAVGIAGQRNSLGVKCLHAHVALALVGIEDPVGGQLLREWEPQCPDERCARLIPEASRPIQRARVKEDT